MPMRKRGTIASKAQFKQIKQAAGDDTLEDEIKDYLDAPPLVSGYLERETVDATKRITNERKRWWCQLKGE